MTGLLGRCKAHRQPGLFSGRIHLFIWKDFKERW
jgi:hypothetical protein